ncbi:unnamed protein product [Fusarium graminearum]|uniref:Chromosome 3, complete genome n=1 Tax=Gibberella zeae (strain ATCC MYA-4620 / CBS 123657 / FGSC 9075 / NRRL 31084 / PH-1) TaxID=229533 RepID=A0A098DVS7_GIBZE|nr:unnamed protein product [Fusarium graminearum]
MFNIGRRKSRITASEQKARKRASDREAQRRIRARTKDYIIHLERELAQLKNNQWRDRTIQELLQRNESTEKELLQLRKTLRTLENGPAQCQPSPFSLQMTGIDICPTTTSDAMKLLASGAGVSHDPHISQNPINFSFLPGNNDLYHLATDVSEGYEDTSLSLSSFTQSPSPAHHLTGYTPPSSYHHMITPGSATAHLFDGTCSHRLASNEFSMNGSADTFPNPPIYSKQNEGIPCSLCLSSIASLST